MVLFRLACVIACFLGAASPLRAEVYLWEDATGRVHMADDLTQVPSAARARARQDAARATRGSQARFIPSTGKIAVQAGPSARPARRAAPAQERVSFHSEGGGARHVLAVQRGARELRVQGEIDRRVELSFVLDSGAQTCTIPTRVAAELGLVADENTPVEELYGIGPDVVRAPVFVLDELRIGDLVVENLKVHVIDGLSEGLLGMPFLNQFRVESDPASGTLTLESIGQ